MTTTHAKRALALVGTPFRPQGRDRAHGLDCVGLCLAVYHLPAGLVRDDYRLRGNHREELEATIADHFRKVAAARLKQGDLLLMRPAADQLHLGITTVGGFVHADARLRQVVEAPGRPGWPIIGTYRLRQTGKR